MDNSSLIDDSNLCSYSLNYEQALEKWSNYSHVWYNDSAYFKAYVCMNVRYESTKEACESAEAQLIFILGIFGFFGALLSTATFFRRPFIPGDVYLYRFVGIIESIHMFIMTIMHAFALYVHCSSHYLCVLFSAHIYMTSTNGCADAVEFVVVFLCTERTIACLAPQHFHRIHRLQTYRLVAIISILSSLPLNIVHSFDVRVIEEPNEGIMDRSSADSTGHKYQESSSWFANTWFYARIMDMQLIRFCVVAPLIILSTAGSIIGLTQAARRKRRLRGDCASIDIKKCIIDRSMDRRTSEYASYQLKAQARSRKDVKQMIDLCCLQLCLAVPVVINYILCLVERACKTGVIDRNRLWEDAFRTMTYEHARSILGRAEMLEYLRLSISITHMLAHGLHFYLYLSFSAKFRHTFANWILIQKMNFIFGKYLRHRETLISENITGIGYESVPAMNNALTDHSCSNYQMPEKELRSMNS